MTRLYTGSDGQAHARKIDVMLMPSATFASLEESGANAA
jgi:hypothetical protein